MQLIKTTSLSLFLVFSLMYCVTTQADTLAPGKPAPDFTLVNQEGKKVSLKDSAGKWVVLEWLNHGCPFVKKHYGAKNMQALQAKYTGQGVVWYSVISSAEGKEGYATPAQAKADMKKFDSKATAVLSDADGKVGRAYGAQTTPHLFVINPKGVVVYMGAIDDKADTEASSIPTAKNYVVAALEAGMAGKPIAKSATKSYGCSIKYKN